MQNSFVNAWHYRITYTDNIFSVYLNDRLVGTLNRSPAFRWPVYGKINNRLISFSKKRSFRTVINVSDEQSGELIGVIALPYFSAIRPYGKFECSNTEKFNWESGNFFSLHWKWKNEGATIMEVIENLAGEANSGVIVIPEYKKGTDILIISGFFLSLLRRSKLTMGLKGFKRRQIPFRKP